MLKSVIGKFYVIAFMLALIFLLGYAQLAYFLNEQSISAGKSRQTMMLENQMRSLQNLFVEIQYWDKAVRYQLQPGAEKQFGNLLSQMRVQINQLIADSRNAAFGNPLQEIVILLAEYESNFNQIIQLKTEQQIQTALIQSNYQSLTSSILRLNDPSFLKPLLNLTHFQTAYLSNNRQSEYEALMVVLESLVQKLIDKNFMETRVRGYFDSFTLLLTQNFSTENQVNTITSRFRSISEQLKTIIQQVSEDAKVKMKSDFEEIETSRNRMHSFFLYSTSLSFLTLMLIISIMSRKIVYPIRTIADVMRNVKAGQIQDRFAFSGNVNDEIIQLGHSFNSMLDTLSENNRELITVQEDLKSKVHELAIREAELEKHRNRLEERVADRTSELQYVINQLQEEIYQRERVQGELKHAKEEAENANQAKSEFLANMSHEIRTPLNGVIGFTAMLMETSLNDKQQEYADIIKRSSDALIYLINDILDFSKIEAGDLEFERIEFNPEQIAFDVCEMIRPRIETKPVEILCRVGHDLPEKLIGDPLRFQQVLTNLMGNATKFTESGEIELNLIMEKQEEHRLKLHVTVRDTGIGIERNKLTRIFLPFHQADGSTTRRYGGTGLGLSICRKIAQLMDGNTWADSEPGKGSTFHFTAWFQIPETIAIKTFSPLPGVQKRLLLLEDNPCSADILVDFFRQLNFQAVVIQDTAGLMPIFQEAGNVSMPFDLIIANVRVQGMNGFEVFRKMENARAGQPKIPMLAISSRIEPDTEECLSAGFDDFLTKPIRREKLYQTTLRLLGQPTDIRIDTDLPVDLLSSGNTAGQNCKEGVKILLAEDNVVNQKLAVAMLTRLGYSVQVANNGQEAVNMYIAHPEAYDLIFMDIQMPIMDGIEATHHIRQKGFKHTPIIAMTAHALKGDREKCLEAGMNDYISKPIKRDLVMDMLKKWFFC
ncbi:MAG: response regulator [Desulfatirhabdiaceae bacterium]